MWSSNRKSAIKHRLFLGHFELSFISGYQTVVPSKRSPEPGGHYLINQRRSKRLGWTWRGLSEIQQALNKSFLRSSTCLNFCRKEVKTWKHLRGRTLLKSVDKRLNFLTEAYEDWRRLMKSRHSPFRLKKTYNGARSPTFTSS